MPATGRRITPGYRPVRLRGGRGANHHRDGHRRHRWRSATGRQRTGTGLHLGHGNRSGGALFPDGAGRGHQPGVFLRRLPAPGGGHQRAQRDRCRAGRECRAARRGGGHRPGDPQGGEETGLCDLHRGDRGDCHQPVPQLYERPAGQGGGGKHLGARYRSGRHLQDPHPRAVLHFGAEQPPHRGQWYSHRQHQLREQLRQPGLGQRPGHPGGRGDLRRR